MVENITRIEFEPLGNGRFRWRLWAGSRLTHDEISRPDTLDAMLLTTKLLCTEVTNGVQHAKEENNPEAHGR